MLSGPPPPILMGILPIGGKRPTRISKTQHDAPTDCTKLFFFWSASCRLKIYLQYDKNAVFLHVISRSVVVRRQTSVHIGSFTGTTHEHASTPES